jgi:threonine dehydrogenase-like Zn-dependent dehydrogenase
MKGLWLERQQLSLRSDLPIPKPGPGEALVRVNQAGICNTDLELIRGYYPYAGVLGHEFVGVVEQGSSEWVGQRVVGDINVACGSCRFCLSNQRSHCENRTVLGIVNHHGAFAEYLCLPEQNLHRVPVSVSTDSATFTEPLAAALEIQQQVKITESEHVLVVGDGKLGQLVAQSLALTGCDLWVVGRHDDKLSYLKMLGIATGTEAPARTFDVAVECTGNPSGFAVALQSLRSRGTLVLKSTYADKLTFDASAIVVDEITLVGSRCGPFDAALGLLAQDKVKVEPLIQARYPLNQGLAAFEHAQHRGVLKVLISMTDSE